MAPYEKGEDLEPKVAGRLARIRGRDIEQIQKDYMGRRLHVKWKLGFMSIYLNPSYIVLLKKEKLMTA